MTAFIKSEKLFNSAKMQISYQHHWKYSNIIYAKIINAFKIHGYKLRSVLSTNIHRKQTFYCKDLHN